MLFPLVEFEDIPREDRISFFRRWAYCSPITLRVPITTVELVKEFAQILVKFSVRIGPISATEVDLIGEWLNYGALQVLAYGTVDEICFLGSVFPKDRVVGMVKQTELESDHVLMALEKHIDEFVIDVSGQSLGEVLQLVTNLWNKVSKHFPSGFSVMLDENQSTNEECAQTIGLIHHLGGHDGIIDVISSNVSLPGGHQLCIAKSLICCLKTDREDRMFTTVVVDEFGVSLGLVYSNSESIVASLECGRGVYWSRSRNSLWRKGDTSGAIQELISISFDCDADALCFKVRQLGQPASFCHKGSRTCWGNDSGIPPLVRLLEERKREAPVGSYTKRLFEDHALLRNKLLEEAQEVVEAVTEQDPVHVAEEVADLLYFLMTACVAGGASLEDACQQLDMRARKVKRRPGNAKDFRIQAANDILNKTT